MKQANLGLNAEELFERQILLQEQATRLLEHHDIMGMLRIVGVPKVVGSADMGLMVWPDLDIEVTCRGQPELPPVLEVVKHLMIDAGVRRMTIRDARGSGDSDSNLPTGIYLGPDVEFDGVMWQVDIWFFSDEEARDRRHLVERYTSRLDDDVRRSILEIKQVAAASDEYHRGVSSVDIYTAVIDHGVTDIDGFNAYLLQTGRSL